MQAGLPDDDAAIRALAKLAQVLPDRLRRRAAAINLATKAGEACVGAAPTQTTDLCRKRNGMRSRSNSAAPAQAEG